MKLSILLAVTLWLLVAPTALLANEPSPDRPSVPALIVGSESSPPFVVDGVCRFAADGGFAFHVATDGQRQVCAVFDPVDGTPIMFSDGQRMLVYDLQNNRVVCLSQCIAEVHVDWDIAAKKRPEFRAGFYFNTKKEKLAEHVSYFRIDKHVSTATFIGRKTYREDGSTNFLAVRGEGIVETICTNSHGFEFRRWKRGKDFYRLILHAQYVDLEFLDVAFAFPELDKLRSEITIAELESRNPLTLGRYLKSLQGAMAKLAIANSKMIGDSAEFELPNLDWDELRRRDKELGRRYRDALANQGIRFSALDATPPPRYRLATLTPKIIRVSAQTKVPRLAPKPDPFGNKPRRPRPPVHAPRPAVVR